MVDCVGRFNQRRKCFLLTVILNLSQNTFLIVYSHVLVNLVTTCPSTHHTDLEVSRDMVKLGKEREGGKDGGRNL